MDRKEVEPIMIEKVICGYCQKTHLIKNGEMSKICWKHYCVYPFFEKKDEHV